MLDLFALVKLFFSWLFAVLSYTLQLQKTVVFLVQWFKLLYKSCAWMAATSVLLRLVTVCDREILPRIAVWCLLLLAMFTPSTYLPSVLRFSVSCISRLLPVIQTRSWVCVKSQVRNFCRLSLYVCGSSAQSQAVGICWEFISFVSWSPGKFLAVTHWQHILYKDLQTTEICEG